MSTGTIHFRGDLEKFAKEIGVALGLATKKIVLDTHAEVTRLTPVDTGRLRAAWVIGVGEPNSDAPPAISQEVQNERAKERTKGNVPPPIIETPGPPDVSGIDGTQPVFLTNNLVYAEPIEDGHSKQAPAGMLKVGVETVTAKFLSDGGSLIAGMESSNLSDKPAPNP